MEGRPVLLHGGGEAPAVGIRWWWWWLARAVGEHEEEEEEGGLTGRMERSLTIVAHAPAEEKVET